MVINTHDMDNSRGVIDAVDHSVSATAC